MASAESAAGTPTRELMFVAGDWTPSESGRFFAVENPAVRGRVIAEVPGGSAADVDRAVRAAHAAFPSWRDAHWRDRGRALARIADAVEARTEELARLLARETGNAIRTQARPEIRGVADVLRYFAGLAGELKGETIPVGTSMLSYTLREPWGVVGAIGPWNAPVTLAMLKIAPALVCGNTVVFKPASEAPLAVLAVAKLCAEHLPAGVLNVVTGSGEEVGGALASHPLVSKVSFTGNTATGRSILRAAADRIVPVTLELGGKSPTIVFPDADDEGAAAGVIAAMRFSRQGQSCTAGSRILVHRDIYDSFLAKVGARLAKLRIGDPLDEATDLGSLISRRQFDTVCDYIRDGLAQEGARLLAGGLPPVEGPLASGYFAVPTIIGDVQASWRIAREEIFGPVAVAIPWTDEDEVMRMANDTHYGLAAYIWSHDIARALRSASRVDAGVVQVNQGGGAVPGVAFGGHKQSGFGREHSLEGMLESYTQRKSVTVNLDY